jgi:hypothetical protein
MGLRILPPPNFFDEASIGVFPVELASLPVANLQSPIRDRVWRSPNLNSQVILGTWLGNARPISAWGIWPGNLVGAQIRVQLYALPTFATQVYDSGVLDVMTYSGVGYGSFAYGAQPWGIDFTDRTFRLAPLVKYFSEVAASSFSITITSAGGMDTNYFEARRIWFSKSIDAPFNARYGAAPAWASSSGQQRSIGGALRRRAGARWRNLKFETMFATEADRATWSDLQYLCDPAVELVLSLFPGDSSARRERDFTAMGSLEVINPMVFENFSVNTAQFQLTES